MQHRILLICALFSLTSISTAQTFPYEFTVLSEPYFDLSQPVSISNQDVWDDPFYITSTGAEMRIFDVLTNTLGILQPGCQIINLNEANPDSVQLLLPYMADIMNANDSMAVSPISYQLEGPPGNAIFKLEWKNVGFYGEWNAAYTFFNTTNFQVWMYQNSGVIEFRYGPNTIKSGSLIHYFNTGPLVLLGKNVAFDGSGWQGLWAVGGDPQNPAITSIPTGEQPIPSQCLLGEPESGTVYRFAPVPIANEEHHSFIDLHAWPSPTQQWLNIAIKPSAKYCIYDIAGRLMTERIAVDSLERLDVSLWPAGQYCIAAENAEPLRFIKQ